MFLLRLLLLLTVASVVVPARDTYSSRPGECPWHAAVYEIRDSNKIIKCGGTLLRQNIVLTAAYCVHELFPQKLSVYLGSHNLNSQEAENFFGVDKVVVHNQFKPGKHEHDIAVLLLKEEVPISQKVRPAYLYNNGSLSLSKSGMGGTLATWVLQTDENGNISYQNKNVEVKGVKYGQCLHDTSKVSSKKDIEGLFSVFSNSNFNFISERGGKMYSSFTKYGHVVGIISFNGISSGRCPTFTNVTHYNDWIKRTIRSLINKRVSLKKCEAYKKKLNPKSNLSHMALIGASVEDVTLWFCAGTIISEDFIIFTRSCYRYYKHIEVPLNLVKVGLADTDKISTITKRRMYAIEETILHPDIKHLTNSHYDIVLIKLKEKMEFNEHIVPACLDTNAVLHTAEEDVVSFDLTGRIIDDLQKFKSRNITVLQKNICDKALLSVPFDNDLSPSQICVTNFNNQKILFMFDTDHLMRKVDSWHHLLAIKTMEVDYNIGSYTQIGSFTNIRHHLNWIENKVWPSSFNISLRASYV